MEFLRLKRERARSLISGSGREYSTVQLAQEPEELDERGTGWVKVHRSKAMPGRLTAGTTVTRRVAWVKKSVFSSPGLTLNGLLCEEKNKRTRCRIPCLRVNWACIT